MVVSNDFDRKVTGYNIYEMPYAWFLSTPVPAVITLSAGPGEVLAIMVVKWTGSNTNYNASTNIKIFIDGFDYYYGTLRDLLLGNLAYEFHGQFSSNSLSPSGYVTSSFRLKLTYDSSCVITVTPGTGLNDGFVVVHARHGG